MTTTKYFTKWYFLPYELTAAHISQFLGLSRKRIYALFQLHQNQDGIPNYTIAASKRVDKDDLKKWIEQKKKED